MIDPGKLRISSFRWQWPGPTGMQHDECHAVFAGDEVVALCPDRDVAQRVLESEQKIRDYLKFYNGRDMARERIANLKNGTVTRKPQFNPETDAFKSEGLDTIKKLRDDALKRQSGRENLS